MAVIRASVQRPPGRVRAVLEGIQPSVAGLRVQAYDDALGPHLLLENGTGEPLEVLDATGRPFLRLDPHGVSADIASAAWYETLSPGGVPVPTPLPDAAAAWRRVRAEPVWSWFDGRLDAPKDSPGSAEPVAEARWSVPLRLGGRTLQIVGRFIDAAASPGAFVARLNGRELTPKVRVELAPGSPPALLLENAGQDVAVVLGIQDEPFLRIGPDGVEANAASPTWQDLDRYRGANDEFLTTGDAPRWRRISREPRYRWLEVRAAMPSLPGPRSPAPDNTRSKVKGWTVPVRVGTQRLAIQGVIEWVPRAGAGAAEH